VPFSALAFITEAASLWAKTG